MSMVPILYPKKCGWCGGSGRAADPHPIAYLTRVCPRCGGTGIVYAERRASESAASGQTPQSGAD